MTAVYKIITRYQLGVRRNLVYLTALIKVHSSSSKSFEDIKLVYQNTMILNEWIFEYFAHEPKEASSSMGNVWWNRVEGNLAGQMGGIRTKMYQGASYFRWKEKLWNLTKWCQTAQLQKEPSLTTEYKKSHVTRLSWQFAVSHRQTSDRLSDICVPWHLANLNLYRAHFAGRNRGNQSEIHQLRELIGHTLEMKMT